jgi:teichuronic acid biosynthesis glycosyltransferase TuaH
MKPKKFKYDILMIALPRWDGKYSSTSYSLAKELSAVTRVFYFDNPFTIKDLLLNWQTKQIKTRLRAFFLGKNIFKHPDPDYPNLIVVIPPLVLPINWLPQGRLYRFLLRLNDLFLKRAVTKTLNVHYVSDFIYINSFNPFYGNFSVLPYHPKLFVYQTVDNISQSEYIAKHGTYLESEIAKKAHLTIVTSTELKKLMQAYSSNVLLLPNAADISHFNRAVKEKLPRPFELKGIPIDTKIICYVGNICQRLDYELLKRIALENEEKILLLVGPKSIDKYKEVGLEKLTNVIFTGSKFLSDLPSYLKHSHCCIIPFVVNTLTRSIYPLKINEYLAAGKPVVTSDFSEDIRQFSDIAYVSQSHDEFISNISIAIDSDNQDKIFARLNRAAQNDWKARAKDLTDILTLELTKNGFE